MLEYAQLGEDPPSRGVVVSSSLTFNTNGVVSASFTNQQLSCPRFVEYSRGPVSVSNGKDNRCSRVIAQSTLLNRSDKVFDVQIMIVHPSELNG